MVTRKFSPLSLLGVIGLMAMPCHAGKILGPAIKSFRHGDCNVKQALHLRGGSSHSCIGCPTDPTLPATALTSSMPTVSFEFSVTCLSTTAQESIGIVGSCAGLGSWSTPVRMCSKGFPKWTVLVTMLKSRDDMRYKYVKVDQAGLIKEWESRTGEDRILSLSDPAYAAPCIAVDDGMYGVLTRLVKPKPVWSSRSLVNPHHAETPVENRRVEPEVPVQKETFTNMIKRQASLEQLVAEYEANKAAEEALKAQQAQLAPEREALTALIIGLRFLLVNELSQRFANALLCFYACQLKKLSDARRVKEAGEAAKRRVDEASRAQAESDRARAARESLELASQSARAAEEAVQQAAAHHLAHEELMCIKRERDELARKLREMQAATSAQPDTVSPPAAASKELTEVFDELVAAQSLMANGNRKGNGKGSAQSEVRALSESRRRAGSLVQEKKLQRMKRYQELKSLIVERYTAEDILSFIDRDAAGDMTMADWVAAFSGETTSAAIGATVEHDHEAARGTTRGACAADAVRQTGREGVGEGWSVGASEVGQKPLDAKPLDAEDVEIIRRIFAKLDKSRDDDVEEPSEVPLQPQALVPPSSSQPEQLQAPTPTPTSQNAPAWGSGHLTSTRGEGGGRGRRVRQRGSLTNSLANSGFGPIRDIEHDTSGAA